jgi:hypothetical protein
MPSVPESGSPLENPALGPARDLPAQRIYDEYAVRHRHGDKPALTAYQVRFPAQFGDVQRLIQDKPPHTPSGAGVRAQSPADARTNQRATANSHSRTDTESLCQGVPGRANSARSAIEHIYTYRVGWLLGAEGAANTPPGEPRPLAGRGSCAPCRCELRTGSGAAAEAG